MSRKTTKPAPIQTPGSPYAVEHGCTCSPLANNYGAGVVTRDGQVVTTTFTIAPGCSMHCIDEITHVVDPSP